MLLNADTALRRRVLLTLALRLSNWLVGPLGRTAPVSVWEEEYRRYLALLLALREMGELPVALSPTLREEGSGR